MRIKTSVLILSLCAAGAQAQAFKADSVQAPARKGAEIIVPAAGSLVINAALTEVLKHSVHELRPDRSENNSFPSRHTSWAFTASTVISNELYRYSPWWSLGAQAVATAIGFDRVVERRHYASDVVAGAALGIASTELAYWISRRIFGTRSAWNAAGPVNDFRPSLAVSTGAIYNFSGEWCTGFSTAIEARLPLAGSWGMAASITGSTTPIKHNGRESQPLNTFGIRAGVAGHFTLTSLSPLAVEPVLEAGAARLLPTEGFDFPSLGFSGRAGIGMSWRLTRNFSCRGTVDYTLLTTPHCNSGIGVSISSVAVF